MRTGHHTAQSGVNNQTWQYSRTTLMRYYYTASRTATALTWKKSRHAISSRVWTYGDEKLYHIMCGEKSSHPSFFGEARFLVLVSDVSKSHKSVEIVSFSIFFSCWLGLVAVVLSWLRVRGSCIFREGDPLTGDSNKAVSWCERGEGGRPRWVSWTKVVSHPVDVQNMRIPCVRVCVHTCVFCGYGNV